MSALPPASPHLDWQSEALWRQLLPLLPGLSVEVRASVASTNATLLERTRGEPGDGRAHGRREADHQPCLLVAERQTAGRGRQGKGWQSAPGASLTVSLALSLSPAHGWSGLSLAVGCALADALDPPADTPPRLLLKWPNDLWLRDDTAAGGGRKLGGILIETAPVQGGRVVVIGIGLNIHPAAATDGDQLASGLGCVDELDPAATPPTVLARVAQPLVLALRDFEARGFASVASRFARRDLLAGRPLRTLGAVVLEGTGAGVDAQGLLQLRAADGQLHAVGSGEVSVRPC